MTLTRTLYANLASGGVLSTANVVPDNPTRWLLEHHMDWFLTHRTRQQSRDIATAAIDVPVELAEEPSGVTPFVVMTKA
jgi:hypothetical protein